tara:strand:- start:679 stop:1404 length:726 start_codon:yes stop_codon:yes gene_type:complete
MKNNFNKSKVSILLLVHNEIKTIERDIISIRKNLKNKINYQLVIVQDGSKDGTFEKLNLIKNKYNLTLSNVKKRRGYTKAFKVGVKKCKNETIFFSDTGSKYSFNNIKKFLNSFYNQKADGVFAYRIERQDKYLRRILTFYYTFFINILFGKNFKDYDCGFKVYKKKILLNILNKYSFTPHLINSQIFIYFFLNKKKIVQLPIKYLETKYRSSRGLPMNKLILIIFKSIINIIRIRINFIF